MTLVTMHQIHYAFSFITAFAKGGFVVGRIVFFLSVSPFVCGHYSKSYECIVMKFCGGTLGGVVKNRLDFGGDLGVLR